MAREEELEQQVIAQKLYDFDKIIKKKKRYNKTIQYSYDYNYTIIADTKRSIAEVYKQNMLCSTPRSIFATCFYIACNHNNYFIDQVKVAKIFGSNGVSLRNNLRKILSEEEHRELRSIRRSNRRNTRIKEVARR